jgi:cysteine synthase B
MDILECTGRTPLVELHGFDVPEGVRLFAKLEGQNPTGSVKDRIVRHMLLQAAAEGRLPPGGAVVEASTGNTAIALAMMGRSLGYGVCVVMPESVFAEIPRALAVYGAETHWVPADLGVKGAIEEAKRIAAETGAFFLDQFGNAHNPQAHYETTGPEILADLPRIDVFVAGLGTGGTLMGVGRRLREADADTKVIAVEPHPGNQLQGLKSLADGFLPPIMDLSALDGKILVRGRYAFQATRELLRREGIFAGVSSGAVLHAGLRWARRMSKGNVVFLFADGGWKYLATPCFAPEAHPSPKDGGELPEDEGESLDDVMWW